MEPIKNMIVKICRKGKIYKRFLNHSWKFKVKLQNYPTVGQLWYNQNNFTFLYVYEFYSIKINYFLNLVISNVVSLAGTDLEDRRIVASSLYREVGSRVGWPGVPPADTLQEEPPLLSATHSWLSSSSPPGRRMQNTEIITVKLALFHHLILPAQPGLRYCPQIFSFQWSEIATGCFLSRQLAYFTTILTVSVRICRDKKPSKKCFCGSLTPPWVSACLSL